MEGGGLLEQIRKIDCRPIYHISIGKKLVTSKNINEAQ